MSEKYILLVEDNPDDVALTQIALKKSRISNSLVVVWDGEEALDFLFQRGQYAARDPEDKPGVIVLDLKLPRVDGLEVLKQIRADKRIFSIPVVILTSSMEDRDRSACHKLGVSDYIRKPTSLTQLIKVMQLISSKWLE